MNLTTKLFFRDCLYRTDPVSKRYVTQAIRLGTDESSEFGITTKDVRTLPDIDMLAELKKRGYDLLIGQGTETLIGHIGFQEHMNGTKDWKVFSVYVLEPYRGRGFSIGMAKDLITRGRELSVDRIQLGTGKRKETQAIVKRLTKNHSLGIVANPENGWINLNSH